MKPAMVTRRYSICPTVTSAQKKLELEHLFVLFGKQRVDPQTLKEHPDGTDLNKGPKSCLSFYSDNKKNTRSMEIKLTRLSSNIEELEALRQKWINLELSSENVTFFTSWTWIGAWLSGLQSNAWVLDVELNNKTVALGFFVERLKGFFPFRQTQLWLNKTGVHEQDQMWIEYNELLIHRDCDQEITSEIWNELFKLETPRFSELHVDMSKTSPPSDFYSRNKSQTEGFIKLLQKNPTGIVADFSRNTRQQINRSKRLLGERGDLILTASKDSKTRLEILSQASIIHKEQWGDTQWGSGFENPIFCRFHEKLVEDDSTVLLKLSLGETAMAFGYYFCFKDTVYFYLSAIERDEDNRVKVGIVFHVLAMEYFQKLGFDKYDFLGGAARYKQSLSDYSYPLYSWCVSRVNWISKTENLARSVKQYLGK